MQPLLSELIKNFSKANAKTPEFRPLPMFEPTQNPSENKDEDVSLLPQHWTPISDIGFQEVAPPRGATESVEEYAPEANPFPPATAKATPSDSGVGGDVDIVAGITKLGERVAGNTKLE